MSESLITPVKAFQDNYIWMIANHQNENVFVVDPGDAEPVIEKLIATRKKLAGILVTHHHHDHTNGIEALIQWSGNIPVYGSHRSQNGFVNHKVKEGDEILCGDTLFHVLEIPGHTLDHIAFWNETTLFSGDTLFSAGCGKVFEGTYEEMFSSLQKLASLSPETKIYCGHEYTRANLLFAKMVEPNNTFIQEKINQFAKSTACTLPSLLKDEKKMNPFLRCDQVEVIKSVQLHGQKTFLSPLEIFTHLREWKNQWVA